MTSFQLFKGMTGIDSEFLLQVERQDSPVSRRLHTKKLWLIAAIIALTLLLAPWLTSPSSGAAQRK